MKKFLACMVAMILCLLPLGALAEMESISVRLTDPVISVNGTPVMDMEGLLIGIHGAVSEDEESGFVQLDVYGGDENALKAAFEFVGDEVVLSVDGMSELYSIPAEDSSYVVSIPLPDGGYAEDDVGAQIEPAVQALVEGELPGKIMVFLNEYGETLGELTPAGKANYTMLSGEMEMEHMMFEMTAEETAAFMDELLVLIGEDADFAALKEILDEMAGEDVLEGKTLQQLYQESGFGMSLKGDVYAKGSAEALEAELTLTMEDEDEPGIVLWRMIREPNVSGGTDFYTDVDLVEADEPVAGAYLAFTTQEDENGELSCVNMDAGAGEYVGADFVSSAQMQAQLLVSPIMIGEVETKQYVLNCVIGDTEFTLNVSGYEKDGELYGMLGLRTGTESLSISFQGNEGTDDSLYGVLTGNVELNGTLYTLETDVVAELGAFEGDRLLDNAEAAIDVDTMTYEQMEEAEIEAVALLFNGVSVLDRNVPGLKGLMKMMVKYFY